MLEEVLEELSRRLSKDDWLTSIRKTREFRRAARQRQQELEDDDEVKAKAKAKSQDTVKLKKAKHSGDEDVESIETTKDGSLQALSAVEEPRQLPSRLPQSKSERHLLLCVAPLGSRHPVPTEDSGFDLIPANIGCTFASGIFSPPDADSTTILYGSGQRIGGFLYFTLGFTQLTFATKYHLRTTLSKQWAVHSH